MAGSSFGELFRFTTWGESHGPAIGVVVDGVPSRLPLAASDIQHWLDRRRPGQSKFTTQRREPDRVEILSFSEPEEYLPRKRWTDLFHGRKLDDDLRLRRGVHGISGATLSAEAATQAVRRVLALHRAIEETAPR